MLSDHLWTTSEHLSTAVEHAEKLIASLLLAKQASQMEPSLPSECDTEVNEEIQRIYGALGQRMAIVLGLSEEEASSLQELRNGFFNFTQLVRLAERRKAIDGGLPQSGE